MSEQRSGLTCSQSYKAELYWDVLWKTIQMEVSRCKSLRQFAGTLLTVQSIISVALLSAVGPLYRLLKGAQLGRPLVVSCVIAMLLLFVSIALAVISQMRLRYEVLPGPIQLRDKFLNNESIASDTEAVAFMSDDCERVYISLEHRNDVMGHLLNWSMGFTIAVILAIILYGVLFGASV